MIVLRPSSSKKPVDSCQTQKRKSDEIWQVTDSISKKQKVERKAKCVNQVCSLQLWKNVICITVVFQSAPESSINNMKYVKVNSFQT